MSDVEMASIDGDDDIDITDIKGLLSGSEEGEINDTDSEDASVHRHRLEQENVSIKNEVTKHSFITEGNDGINRSIFDDIDLAKMEERANRFGLDKSSDTITLEKEMKDLHENFSINTDEDIRHARMDTIHVYGTDNMKTNDIFEYFFSHRPLFMEWVNDSCCNVVWKDDISAARAMVFYSKEIVYPDKKDSNIIINGKDSLTDSVNASDIKVPIPPGKWRAGAPHPKANFIFMRFAKKSDKKVIGKDKLKIYSKKYVHCDDSDNVYTGIISESMKSKIKTLEADSNDFETEKSKNPWGELCQTWGINDSQEVFGVPKPNITPDRLATLPYHGKHRIGGVSVKNRIGGVINVENKPPITERLSMPVRRKQNISLKMRLGKRSLPAIDVVESSSSEEEESSDEEWTTKSKIPRMRMHADDELEKIKKTKHRPDGQLLSQEWEEEEEEEDANNITVKVRNDISDERIEPRGRNRSRPNRNRKAKDLRSRLGRRRNSYSSESDNSSSDLRQRSSAVNKVSSRQKPSVASTVWSRLDKSQTIKDESYSDPDSEHYRDLRQSISKNYSSITAKRPGFDKGDLRSRIGKKIEFKECPLRIEVDNELCVQSDED